MKFESVDGAEFEHPLDSEVGAHDREPVPVGADLSQRDAQLSEGGDVDVIDRAKIDRDPAKASVRRPLAAASHAKTAPAAGR